MKKKLFILVGCIFVILIACQKQSTTMPAETSNNETGDKTNNALNNANQPKRFIPNAPLQKKDESADVKSLQRVLSELGYPVDATAIYDKMTTWAITDIQLQTDLQVSGMYDEHTRETVKDLFTSKGTFTAGKMLDTPLTPDKYPKIIENPYDVLALVNKNHALPENYEPEDLVIPDVRFPYEEDIPKKHLREIAAEALEDLIAAGDDAGVTIFAQSGFRSFDRQETIFASNADKNGIEHANTYSAKAGESEHQTGLVMDVTAEEVGFSLNTDFAETAEGKWIKDHAHEYGFIIRYPENKTDITQYQFEPWHLRYVGETAATEIYENGESLEEYLGAE